MRKLLSAIAVIACITTANAQPPEEIVTTDTIEMRVGQTRTFQFDQSVRRIELASKGIASVVPETDQTFTIQALQPGEVLTTAYAEDGHVVHRMYIAVAGRMVKIYGHSKVEDYVGFICTDTGCARADPDVEPVPSKVTISETHQKPNGDSTTVEKQYR